MIERQRTPIPIRPRRQPMTEAGELGAVLASKIVGQPAVIEALTPCVEMFQAGLSPENRPAGVFLLLGPTGTGKTRTVEALAEVLHGTAKSILKIDCGEYQMEHEVAKLIGAPPGYLGHRETQPALTQQKLSAVTSEKCGLSLVLFDEIEKAAPSLARLMLGLLDRGILRLGDNTQVSFEKSIVFMTSNLGAREMMREMVPEMGFQSAIGATPGEVLDKLKRVAMSAVRRKFSPEFVNRIDRVITYQPLDAAAFAAIVDHEVDGLQRHVMSRLGARAFSVDIPWPVRQWLMERGTSAEYGARELKRTIHRHLTQPLAAMVARGQVDPGSCVLVSLRRDRESLVLGTAKDGVSSSAANPTVLLVDRNRELLQFLERVFTEERWEVVTATTTAEARRAAAKRSPHCVVAGASLTDGCALDLLVHLRLSHPELVALITSQEPLPGEREQVRLENGIGFLRKPFTVREALGSIRLNLRRPSCNAL